MRVALTKRVSTGDYEFEEITIDGDFEAKGLESTIIGLRQAAFNGLALKLRARIEAHVDPDQTQADDLDDAPEPETKPKRTRRTKAEMEAARAAEAAKEQDDPFAEDEKPTAEADLDDQLDDALAKDDDDFDSDDEVLIRKADYAEVRATLNRLANEVSKEAAVAVLTKFGVKRMLEIQPFSPEKRGEVVTEGERVLKNAQSKK